MTKLKFLICVLLVVNTVFSQQKTITGTVTSDGVPLPGATIAIAGTQQGTQTDEKGKYSLKVNQGDVLEFSFLGKETKAITVGTENEINVVLATSSNAIECLVVTMGYSSSKKSSKQRAPAKANKTSNATIEINTTFSDEITKLSSEEFETKNEPLFYIDGEKASKKELDIIDNKTINSIKVIKVEDAIKVFGQKGKNGVIIIETQNNN
jgi:hypothetical protein